MACRVSIGHPAGHPELAKGRRPGAWGTICAVGGASYLASVALFARRG
jgi:hypothetical protein